jgi:hypothetical protein
MLNLTLERIERQIRNLPVEHVYVLGPDNEILFHHTDNLPDQVRFPVSMLTLWDLAIVTHNHHGGRSFSRVDVDLARAADLAHLRGRHESIPVFFKAPPDGWPAVTVREFDDVVAREALLLESELKRDIQRQALTHPIAQGLARTCSGSGSPRWG